MDSQPTRKPIWPKVCGLIGIVVLLPFVFDTRHPPKKDIVQTFESLPDADKVAWQRLATRLHEDEMLRRSRHIKVEQTDIVPFAPGERPLDDISVSDQIGQ